MIAFFCLVAEKIVPILLKILTEKYGLKLLLLTVDNGLLNKTAKKNIKSIIEKLGVNHLFVTPEKKVFKKIYRYYLLNPQGEHYCDSVCGVCNHFIHSIGLRVAAEKKIPFIAIGYSPDQTDHYFYEITKKEVSENWTPKELVDNNILKKENEYFWNPKEFTFHPRVLLPFHVIYYPSFKQITKELSKSKLIKPIRANPLFTNCDLIWLLIQSDQKRFKYNKYLDGIAEGIREGRLKYSSFYLIVTLGLWLLLIGLFKRKQISNALKYIDFKKEEINALFRL